MDVRLWVVYKKLRNCKRKLFEQLSSKNLMTQCLTFFFKIKFLTVTEFYLKYVLKFSLKCFHKVHGSLELNDILNVDCNHSYRTRLKTAQLVIPKSAKTKLLTKSLEHRGRVLLNFLLQKRS